MKKIVLVLMSVLMWTGLSAKENHLEGADTGILVELVGQTVPFEKIEIINPTCVVGMTNLEEADGIPAVSYSYWSGECGIMQNTWGLGMQKSEAVNLFMVFDKGLEDGVLAFRNWIKDHAPKDDGTIEEQARCFMKKYNKKDRDYILFRGEDKKIEMGRIIVIIYCTKELAKKRGIKVD